MTPTSAVMARAESAIKPGYDLKVTAPARPVIVNSEVAILSGIVPTIRSVCNPESILNIYRL